MRNIVVKIEKKEKDHIQLGVHWKVGENKLNLQSLHIWYEDEKISTTWGKQIYQGYLCERCKAVVLDGIADGHINFENKAGGLCAVCANTEEIYSKYFGD